MSRPIYPSFGEFSAWHWVAGAPDGPLDVRTEWVVCQWSLERARDRPAERAEVRPRILRAMTLELLFAFACQRRKPPPELFQILAEQVGLPDTFLDDPVPVFQGELGGGRPPVSGRARTLAMELDRQHFQTTGSIMAANALANRLKAELNLERPYSRATLDRWRLEPDYEEWLTVPISPLPKSD